MPGAVFQSNLAQLRHRPFFRFGFRHLADEFQRFADITERRHVRPEIELLENHAGFRADSTDLVGGQALAAAVGVLEKTKRFSVDGNQAAARFFQKGKAAQQCALAGSRWTNEAGNLALRNFQVDVLQHGGFSEPLDEFADGDGG